MLCTANGADALEVLRENDEVSLVIVDWMMPVMDGIEFCRRVRDDTWSRYVFLLMLTALGEKKHIAEAMDAGADEHTTKPLNREELKARLKTARRVIRMEQELTKKVVELEEMNRTIRQLKELLPICSYCKKIRNDDNYWQRIEDYIHTETGTGFSHSICPDCMESVVEPELKQLEQQGVLPAAEEDGVE